MDCGFVVVIVYICGSQMFGCEWYEDGKMGNKMNIFIDFIDVIKGLIEQKYVDLNCIFVEGGSVGGLLMGVIVNMVLEFYIGIVVYVFFVDVVMIMSDVSILFIIGEYIEWGNFVNKEEYEYMLFYLFYDQVKVQKYLYLFVIIGLYDLQVQYFEFMKWVVCLCDKKIDDNLLLFIINMEVGYGGVFGCFKCYE